MVEIRKKKHSAQSTVEYFLMMVALLVLLISTGTIPRMQSALKGYFSGQVSQVAGVGG